MSRFNLEALAYSICWAALAAWGGLSFGWTVGLALSVGLFPIIMVTSAAILSRSGSFKAERIVRWGLLLVAALGVLSYADLHG